MNELNRRSVMQVMAAAATLPASVAPFAAQAQDATTTPASRRISLDFDWRFALGHATEVERDFGFGRHQKTFAKQGANVSDAAAPAFDDSRWQNVNVPHDWAIDLPFVKNEYFIPPKNPEDGDPAAGHGYKAIGRKFPENSIGWYRKVLMLDKADEDKRLSLEFDGVFRDATLIFNGYVLHRQESGYSPFSVEISDFLSPDGKNILLVRVDASLGEGWFYEGAGIYRHVWLVKTPKTYMPQWGVCVRPEVSGHTTVQTDVVNGSDGESVVTLTSNIVNAEGVLVATQTSKVTLPPREHITHTQQMVIASPRLWDIDTPYLYTVHSNLQVDGDGSDTLSTPFGLREFRFDAHTGFWLNGKALKIRGVNNHQDHAGVGVAIPDALHTWRVAKTKELGANTWRCAHNPPSPELLDACDRLGMLVVDETRMMTSASEGLSQLETLIRRDRNHPSIILWSIGNEETAQQGTARGLKIAMNMRRVVRSLDTTRPVTAAMNHFMGYGITPALDVMGFNYHEADIEPFRKLYPDMPILGTETASAVSTRGEYVRDDIKGYVRAYDLDAPSYALTAEAWWTLYNSKPYLSGGLVWTGFDYRGEPTPFNRWPEISSHFGIFDTCGFPKDIYHYYRAWWQDEPVLHLLPHWNWAGQEGKTIPVWAYSNLDAVELFVNGRSLGRKTVRKDSHVEWDAVYAPGEIVVYGYRNGKVVMKDSRKTAGPAYRLSLTTDRQTLNGDGLDIVPLRVEVLDSAGVPVPRADNLVHFAVDGPAEIIGVGNGNPTSLEADRATSRQTFNGLAQAILQSRKQKGTALVTAYAEGLVSGKLSVIVGA